MERFAIKINDSVKSSLLNLCRLCGIDNPQKISILDECTWSSDVEPDLCRKILVCVGVQVGFLDSSRYLELIVIPFQVLRNDKMPQAVCTLCADKIGDFFEFREMCSATNVQTRQLLGLPDVVEKKKKKLPPVKRRKIKIEEEESIFGVVGDASHSEKKPTALKLKKQSKGTMKNGLKKQALSMKSEVKLVKAVEVNDRKLPTRKKNKDSALLTLKQPNKRERTREMIEKKSKK